MKNILILFLIVSSNYSKGQLFKTFPDSSIIRPYCLEVTDSKTTSLVFSSTIKSVDRGSKYVLVQKPAGVENILMVKADVKKFDETNLTVITSDGKLYSFIINYNDSPPYQTIKVNESLPVIYSDPEINKAQVKAYSLGLLDSAQNISRKDKNGKVTIVLDAIYNTNDMIFFRIHLYNRSSLNYDVEQLRFYTRDRDAAKRTASQETELRALYIYGDTTVIRNNKDQTLVIALPKFTIPDKKLLAIEMMEKDGGRYLFLKIKDRHLMKSKIINH